LPSKRSRFFNLDEATLSGHLRPDLIAAIDVQRIPSADGLARGIGFHDAAGEMIFGIFISGEGREPSAAQVAAFEATWSLLASLPRRGAAPAPCGRRRPGPGSRSGKWTVDTILGPPACAARHHRPVQPPHPSGASHVHQRHP
jgi:hypothetical protein